MGKKLTKWLRKNDNKITESIAFYPILIAIGFLFLSWVMLHLDFSATGKFIKSNYNWIKLKDASTARTVVSTVVGGVISLTVFSFSMVMIVLTQAASQMSNRMLEGMISNRLQQIILGFYIGTIVYGLFLLSSIREIDSGVYVPALSIYLLILVTVADIFMFIYFLHYVTQTVKFETIIERVHKQTLIALQKQQIQNIEIIGLPKSGGQVITMQVTNYYQGFDEKKLLTFAAKHNGIIQFLYAPGTYILENIEFLMFHSIKQLTNNEINELLDSVDFYPGQPIHKNAYFGFHQLTEAALKALSPGINDPQTAVLSLHALTDLLLYKMNHYAKTAYWDQNNHLRMVKVERSFEELLEICYYPIWDYGFKDRYIQTAMQLMLDQLISADQKNVHTAVLYKFLAYIGKQIEDSQIKVR